MVYIHNGLLLNHKKWKFAICNSMDGSREYHDKWKKSERTTQILYKLTYMWNLRNRTGNRDSPGSPVVDSTLALQGSAVRSLVRELRFHMLRELRFHMLRGMAKKETKHPEQVHKQRQIDTYRNNGRLPKGWAVGSWVE